MRKWGVWGDMCVVWRNRVCVCMCVWEVMCVVLGVVCGRIKFVYYM